MTKLQNVNTVGWSADKMQEHVFECHERIAELELTIKHKYIPLTSFRREQERAEQAEAERDKLREDNDRSNFGAVAVLAVGGEAKGQAVMRKHIIQMDKGELIEHYEQRIVELEAERDKLQAVVDLNMEPLEMVDGVVRFRKNEVVRYLLDHGGIDLNDIWMEGFPADDMVKFYQLIGYSAPGYGEVIENHPTVAIADKLCQEMMKGGDDAPE